MALARKVNLDGIRFEVQCELLLKSQVRECKVEGLHARIFLKREGAFTGEIRADHDRRWTNNRVSPLMIRMIVCIHNVVHGQAGDSPDRAEQFGSFRCIEPRVDHQDPRVSHQKSGIRAGIVVGDIGVKSSTNRLDRWFSRSQGRADRCQNYKVPTFGVPQTHPRQKLSFKANWISLGPPDPRPTLSWAASGVVKSAPKLGAAEMLLGKAKLG